MSRFTEAVKQTINDEKVLKVLERGLPSIKDADSISGFQLFTEESPTPLNPDKKLFRASIECQQTDSGFRHHSLGRVYTVSFSVETLRQMSESLGIEVEDTDFNPISLTFVRERYRLLVLPDGITNPTNEEHLVSFDRASIDLVENNAHRQISGFVTRGFADPKVALSTIASFLSNGQELT